MHFRSEFNLQITFLNENDQTFINEYLLGNERIKEVFDDNNNHPIKN